MIVLEGIAVTGDPSFDLFSSAYPYALQRAVSLFGVANVSEIAREAVVQMRRRARAAKDAEEKRILSQQQQQQSRAGE